jgi:hypothetical protein
VEEAGVEAQVRLDLLDHLQTQEQRVILAVLDLLERRVGQVQ